MNILHHTIDILRDLVAFDTTSYRSNLAMVDYIKNYLATHQIDCIINQHPTQQKANLLATIGPNKAGGIILSGHMDVVPTKGQAWQQDPFTLTQKKQKLYGRGTADMKGFIASALAMVPHINPDTLHAPIHLIFSYDEEVGCQGIPHLLEELDRHIKPAKYAIIGEPTSMQPIIAHKGITVFQTHIHTQPSHSSIMRPGGNAIHAASQMIEQLNSIWSDAKKQHHQDEFDPPFSTYNIGTIQGGNAVNITAEHCQFDWEIRNIPSLDPQYITQQLDHFSKQLQQQSSLEIETKTLCHAPALTGTLTKKPFIDQLYKWSQSKQTGHVSFATEGGLFEQCNIPTIICGPGSIQQAHKANEFITIDELQHAIDFFGRLLTDWRT